MDGGCPARLGAGPNQPASRIQICGDVVRNRQSSRTVSAVILGSPSRGSQVRFALELPSMLASGDLRSLLKRMRDAAEVKSGPLHSRVSRRGASPYFIRLYLLNAVTTRSPGKPKTRMPSAPVIVCAASIALTTASSVASIVA